MTLTINNFYVFFPGLGIKNLRWKQFRASEIPMSVGRPWDLRLKMLDVDRLVAGSESPKEPPFGCIKLIKPCR